MFLVASWVGYPKAKMCLKIDGHDETLMSYTFFMSYNLNDLEGRNIG